MTPACAMPRCGRPIPDQAYLCPVCGGAFAQFLGNLPPLIAELETTRVGRARIGAAGGGARSSGDRDVPWHDRAGRLADQLAGALLHLARFVGDRRGVPVPTAPPGTRPAGPRCADQRCGHATCGRVRALDLDDATQPAVTAAAQWLVDHVDWLRHRPEGPGKIGTLTDLATRGRRVIDRGADGDYAGRCWAPKLTEDGSEVDCQAELYARPGAAYVDCRQCGTSFDVRERRVWMLARCRDYDATAAEAARALSALGREVKVERIRQWAHRGRLVAHGWLPTGVWEPVLDEDGQPTGEDRERLAALYRIGDVEQLLDQADAAAARLRVSA
jgi:hypothetical protein